MDIFLPFLPSPFLPPSCIIIQLWYLLSPSHRKMTKYHIPGHRSSPVMVALITSLAAINLLQNVVPAVAAVDAVVEGVGVDVSNKV
jgi:hypothetical protein